MIRLRNVERTIDSSVIRPRGGDLELVSEAMRLHPQIVGVLG